MRLTGIREASRLVLESGALAGRVAGRLEERRVRDTVTTHSQRDYGGPSWLPAPVAELGKTTVPRDERSPPLDTAIDARFFLLQMQKGEMKKREGVAPSEQDFSTTMISFSSTRPVAVS